MDISRLSSDIKYVSQIGATLNIEEKMKLELSLLKITETEPFDEVVFWGKINGVKFDYYIAVGLNFRGKIEFPTKKFYWAKYETNILESYEHFDMFRGDTFEFDELPEVNLEHRVQVDSFRNLFSGDHKLTLIALNESQQNEADVRGHLDSDEDEIIKIKPKAFTELDRLAFVVHSIENDCAVVPVGAYKITPTHELRHNETFKGVALADITNPASYQHFRAPQSEEKKKFIARDDALTKLNFLDPISEDFPKGSWSIQLDSAKTSATVRSLVWPGFIGYHRANSQIFGYAYLGNGIKNSDLAFLL